jgi:Spy/CpxP family protein refolding chaperone
MTKVVVTAGFLVAFAAGLVVGMKVCRTSASPTTRPGHRGSWLATELDLTAQQQEQLSAIWSETARGGGRDGSDRRRQLARERDEAIAALVRTEDKARYDKILADYAEKTGAMELEWRGSYEASVERTKEILTPKQRARYDELLKQHRGDRGSRDWRRGERDGEPGRRGGHSATSRATSGPAR